MLVSLEFCGSGAIAFDSTRDVISDQRLIGETMKKIVLATMFALGLSLSASTSVRAETLGEFIRMIVHDFERHLDRHHSYPAPGPLGGVGLPFILASGFYIWRRKSKASKVKAPPAAEG
jgi:hypothetical protein